MTNSLKYVVEWFADAERMLADFLEYVPYCDKHEEVWSPKLVIVLQEACSQLDSLWRWEAVNIHNRKDSEVDIARYFELYGSQMAPRWLVFWADKPEKVQPFSEWQGTQYHPLGWWTEGYNKVKHNRLENRNCATLKYTVEALAGLFLAIVRCEQCWDAIWEKGWMSRSDSGFMHFEIFDCLKEDWGLLKDEGRCNVMRIAIETKLFTYPVGLCSGVVTANKNLSHWSGNCSNRFKKWFYDYCQSDQVCSS